MQFNNRLDSSAAAAGNAPSARRETAAICRERAAADLLASVAMLNANQRARMETSAAIWTQRANMLQRVEAGLARKAAPAGAAVTGDAPAAEPPRL